MVTIRRAMFPFTFRKKRLWCFRPHLPLTLPSPLRRRRGHRRESCRIDNDELLTERGKEESKMGAETKAKGDVRHLDHFVVAVMDPDRAEKFYSGILGARTLKREDTPNMTRVFMKLGENHVGLFSQGKATLPKRESAASYPRHCFLVPANEFEPMKEKIRRESPFVRDIQAESGLGCCWN